MRQLGGLLVLILLFGGGWLLLDGSGIDGDFSDEPTADPTTSATPSGEPSDDPPIDPRNEDNDCNARRGVINALQDMGFKRRSFEVGENMIDWDAAQVSDIDQSFSPSPLFSRPDLRSFLQADTAASVAARRLIDYSGSTSAQHWWVPVQFGIPIAYSGNYYWDDANAIGGGNRTAPADDVWWLAVSRSDCDVEPSRSIRAACGNVGFIYINPGARRE